MTSPASHCSCQAESHGSACGKVILLGEHAVVYGVPALALGLAVPLEARARFAPALAPTLSVHDRQGPWVLEPSCELLRAFDALLQDTGGTAPIEASVRLGMLTSAGLGSSAAFGVALARAVLALRELPTAPERVMQAASAWERVFHGNPSGIDVAAATLGGALWFSREQGPRPLAMRLPLSLCIGDSGLRSSTKQMVAQVAEQFCCAPPLQRRVLQSIEALVAQAESALLREDWTALGTCMNQNHALLRQLGLCPEPVEALCTLALQAGALGAKVTGAGGGGCVIALAPGNEQAVLQAWKQQGFSGFCSQTGAPLQPEH